MNAPLIVHFPQALLILWSSDTGSDFFDNRQYAGCFSTKVWLVQLIDSLRRYQSLLTNEHLNIPYEP